MNNETKVTKQQAIKELVKLGVTNIEPYTKTSIKAVLPDWTGFGGKVGVYDPRDLLTELRQMVATQK